MDPLKLGQTPLAHVVEIPAWKLTWNPESLPGRSFLCTKWFLGFHPLLQEPLKIKDANAKPGFEPVANRKQGFPPENPVLLLKTHTKAIQNPYVCMLSIKPGFPAKNPVIFENL